MTGGNALAYCDELIRYEGMAPFPRLDPEQMGFGHDYRIYAASHGWVFLAAPNSKDWINLVLSLEHLAQLTDTERTTLKSKVDDNAMADVLQRVFRARPAHESEALLVPRGVACVKVFEGSLAEFTAREELARVTGLAVDVEHPLFGTMIRHGLPFTFSSTPGRLAPGCIRGEHAEAILQELGYDTRQIADLLRRKIVGSTSDATSEQG